MELLKRTLQTMKRKRPSVFRAGLGKTENKRKSVKNLRKNMVSNNPFRYIRFTYWLTFVAF